MFKFIGEIKASANSTTTKINNYIDKNAGSELVNQKIYYRLRIERSIT
jgi:hypothetical protein